MVRAHPALSGSSFLPFTRLGFWLGGGVRFLPQGYIYILGTSVPSFTLGQTDGFDHTKLRLPSHEGYHGRRVRHEDTRCRGDICLV